MSASFRESIIDRVVAVLDGVGKPSGLSVHRQRTVPMVDDNLPSIIVYCVTEQSERVHGRNGSLTRHNLRLRCELRVSGDISADADTLVDPLYVWAVQSLFADSMNVGAGSLKGLIDGIEEVGVEWDADTKDKLYAAAGLDFLIAYTTSAVDPTART